MIPTAKNPDPTTTRYSIDALLRLPAVLTRIQVSPSTWWRGVKSGKYPAPVKIGERATAWKSSDIDALIESL